MELVPDLSSRLDLWQCAAADVGCESGRALSGRLWPATEGLVPAGFNAEGWVLFDSVCATWTAHKPAARLHLCASMDAAHGCHDWARLQHPATTHTRMTEFGILSEHTHTHTTWKLSHQLLALISSQTQMNHFILKCCHVMFSTYWNLKYRKHSLLETLIKWEWTRKLMSSDVKRYICERNPLIYIMSLYRSVEKPFILWAYPWQQTDT